MSYFDKAIIEVLKHEGGYVNNPADPGGETNFGLCKRTYPMLNIKALTLGNAIEVYRKDFWSKWYDEFTDYRVAAKVFDAAVNMGKAQAHKLLQRVVGTFDDGVIGPKTVAAANEMDADKLLDGFTEQQQQFYDKIIANKPSSKVFLAGWTKRATWHPVG